MNSSEKYLTFADCTCQALKTSRGSRLPAPSTFSLASGGSSGQGFLDKALLRSWSPFVGWNFAYMLAAGVNVAVLGYIAHKLYKSTSVQLEQLSQLKKGANRCWQLATQGSEAAGAVPEDLGQPDEQGVFTHTTTTGTMYFRQACRSSSGGGMYWEFSTDRVLWIPACHADSLWYNPDSCPSTADKLLIQRLEVETQLVQQQTTNAGSTAELPELDLSAAVVDVTRLSQVPPAFLCPISMQVMTQPVVTPSGGSFNRPALMEWIRQHHTDPVSGAPLRSDQVFPNLAMRDMIHAWACGCAAQHGRSSKQRNEQQQQHIPKVQATGG